MKSRPHLIELSLILITIVACRNGKDSEQSTDSDSLAANPQTLLIVSKDQFTTAGMAFGGVEQYNDAEKVTANGYVEVPPENRVRIGTFMGGHVKSVDLLPGDYVRKGQTLIVLENNEYIKLQQNYLEAKEQLSYLHSVYVGQKTLAEEKISAERTFLESKSNYNQMLATYESLAKQLHLINIDPSDVTAESLVSSIILRSPIEGYITEVNAVNGMFVNPSDVLCEIINTGHFHLELKVFEKDLLKIRKGQAIDFRVPEASQEACKGEVVLVGKAVSGSERTIPVHGHITGKCALSLASGMYIEAVINTNTRQVYGLPVEALITEDGKHFVFARKLDQGEGYTFEKLPVQVGKITEEWFELLNVSAIKQFGENNILVKGAYYLAQDI